MWNITCQWNKTWSPAPELPACDWVCEFTFFFGNLAILEIDKAPLSETPNLPNSPHLVGGLPDANQPTG